MSVADDSRWSSSATSRSLTPPQSRIPLSSSSRLSSAMTTTSTSEIPPINITLPDSFFRAHIPATMNKDATFTYIHMHHSHHADLFEDFCKDRLPRDDVYVPPDLQPVNPEEEDDVVPDQHAAYGVQKATQKAREPAWRDLGLGELMARGPGPGAVVGTRRADGNGGGGGAGRRRGGVGGGRSQYQGLPR